MTVWFEDLVPGRIDRYGGIAVTREEAIEFARKFDPQPFHLDDEAAAANPLFGRLTASGWHTAALGMRMTADYWTERGGRSILGGAGVDSLRWLKPVFPGDVLRCEAEILDQRISETKPDRGIVRARLTLFNQHDEAVMRQDSVVIVARRPDEREATDAP